MVKITIPRTRKGISLPMMKMCFFMGVTLICSIVPLSFSWTILKADCMAAMAVTRVTRMAGTMYNLKFMNGLYQLDEATLICGASSMVGADFQLTLISSLKSFT